MQTVHKDNNAQLPVFRVSFDASDVKNKTVSELRKVAESVLKAKVDHIHATVKGVRQDFVLSNNKAKNYLTGSSKLEKIDDIDLSVPVDFDMEH